MLHDVTTGTYEIIFNYKTVKYFPRVNKKNGHHKCEYFYIIQLHYKNPFAIFSGVNIWRQT